MKNYSRVRTLFNSACLVFLAITFLSLSACQKTPDLLPDNPYDNPPDTNPPVFAGSHYNIIFILSDDIGYEVPTYSGGQSYSTPSLDFMAANGTQFTQCHGNALCSPSRFMLATGKYNFRNYDHWGIMDTSQRTFANLLKDAGYTTCVSGKWQFDGGDESIRKFGFDKYMVNNAYNLHTSSEEEDSYYKDPQIYVDGAYLPAYKTLGKYGEDFFRQYIFDFIDSNAHKKPFFVYWAMNLCHAPFSPTPDDPEFASWDPKKPREYADTLFFPSMVKYMDKEVGLLLDKLRAANVEDSTIVIFTGDNGTTNILHSLWNGEVIPGGKSYPSETGTHMPLVAYCPGTVPAGATDTSLISFVDFLATFGEVANKKIPGSYGITDGLSFAPQLKGEHYALRDWIFCHYTGSEKFYGNPQHLKRWIQDYTYKQYDVLVGPKSQKFYDFVLDPYEQHPISPQHMTPQQKAISDQFLHTMSQLH